MFRVSLGSKLEYNALSNQKDKVTQCWRRLLAAACTNKTDGPAMQLQDIPPP